MFCNSPSPFPANRQECPFLRRAVTNALRGAFLQKAQNHLPQQLHFILQARRREVSVHMLQVGYRDLDRAAQKTSSTEASSWLCRKEAAIGMVLGKSLCPGEGSPTLNPSSCI